MSPLLPLLLLSLPAEAFRLAPMVADIAPTGKGATLMVLLDNPEKERAVVQLELKKRKVDADGKEDRSEAADGFVLYPEQVTLDPGQRRNVRVTWTGEAAPERELPFRLVASEVRAAPAKAGGKAEAKPPVEYVASLYVVPKDAKPDVAVKTAKLQKPGFAEVTLENRGERHRVLEDVKLKIRCAKESYQVPDDALKDLRTQNLLAGFVRRFTLPVPRTFTGELAAEILFPESHR